MSTIEERVKKVVAERLNVKEEDIQNSSSLQKTWVLIRSTPLSWLWLWKRNSILKFLMKKLRRSPRFKKLSIT